MSASDAYTDLRAQLEVERRRYQELLSLTPDAFLVTDAYGKIEEANANSQALFGINRHFLLHKPLATLVAPPARRAFRRFVLALAKTKAPTQLTAEYRMERRGGIPFDAHITVSPISDPIRQVARLGWVIRDVTEQRQTEERLWELNAELERRVGERAIDVQTANAELVQQRAQFETVMQQLHVGIIVVSPSGEIVVRNSHAEELLGASVDDAAALEATLLDAEGRPFAGGDWPLAPAFENGEVVSGQLLTLVRDGRRPVLLEASAAPITSDERIAGTAVVLQDVTADRRRDHAQRAFVVNAAHELRTPLASIVSAIEVLQSGAKEEIETRDVFLAHIQRESDRLVRLVRSLLLLARAQANEEQPQLTIVPLAPLLGELIEGQRTAPAVNVRVDCEETLGALTNADLLRQALSSLLGNAAQYTQSGEIVLRGRTREDNLVAVEISDTGPGLSEQARELAVYRFVRGSEQSDGFGLGLAIATAAARAAGGELELESEEGRGTTARIVVQLARLVRV